MKTSKKILLALLAIVVIMQFFQPDRSVPQHEASQDLFAMRNAPEEVVSLLKTACYDCHSYTTNYPWYAYIAPVSWIVSHDIEEGREHLNFSIWGTYEAKKRAHKLEECEEEVEEKEMPLKGYTVMHPAADLDMDQREMLELWFTQQRNTP
jgi:hypothetical protein